MALWLGMDLMLGLGLWLGLGPRLWPSSRFKIGDVFRARDGTNVSVGIKIRTHQG